MIGPWVRATASPAPPLNTHSQDYDVWLECEHAVTECTPRTVFQIKADTIVQTLWAEPPTSFLQLFLDVLKPMWISRFHSGGCHLPTVYPNSFLLSLDFSTMCQINLLPAQKAVKWMPWHFEFLSVIFCNVEETMICFTSFGPSITQHVYFL